MEEVTLEIQARLDDQASKPMRMLTLLSDKLNSSLETMRARMKLIGAEAASLSASAARLTPADKRASGTAARVSSDMSGAGASAAQTGMSAATGAALRVSSALGELAARTNAAGGAMDGLSAGAQKGAVQWDAAMGALGGAFNAGTGGARVLASACNSASAAVRASNGAYSQGASSARALAVRLNALGSAAGALKGRLSAVTVSGAAHAEGGILSTPHVGLVAEDGPEAIIPLGGKRRARGMELWRRAGEALGVREYAAGGVPSAAGTAMGSINMGGVNVNISLGSNAAPGDAIRQGSGQIADDVARAIAEGLERALRNMA